MDNVKGPPAHRFIGAVKEEVLPRQLVAGTELLAPALGGECQRFERSSRALSPDHGDVVSSIRQLVSEVVRHQLDAAIAGGRNRKPGADNESNPTDVHMDRMPHARMSCSNVGVVGST